MAAAAQGYINPMAALATQIPHAALNGTGGPVNGTIPSLPSPTIPTFNMAAAQTPNGHPSNGSAESATTAVYTANGIPQTFPGREYIFLLNIIIITLKEVNFALPWIQIYNSKL